MRLKTVLVAGAIVALCTASDALAQRGGRGFFRRLGNNVYYMSLLRVEKVQDAVDLTDDQQQKLEAAGEELAEARRAARGQRGGSQSFQDMTDAEREEFFARIRERNAERAKAEKAKVAEILNDGQMKRLGEIFVQVAGADALDDADVAAALKITDDQKEKIAAARDDAQDKIVEETRDIDDFQERFAKMAELRTEADKAVLAVLTADQQKQFEDLKGEPLELTQQELNRARRGGFGRRGGGRGGRGRGGRGGQ